MKKIIQLTSIMILLTGFITHAEVTFSLTNKGTQPIILIGYVNGSILKLNSEGPLPNIKTLKSDETLFIAIENGKLDLIINITGDNKQQYKYETSSTANNKDKILEWNGSKLYPSSEKHHLIGPFKAKTTIKNNISAKELVETERTGF